MSMIPAGLLANLPAALWPDTISIESLTINVDDADETSPTEAPVNSGIAARRVPISGNAEPQMLSVYPDATHKFLTRALVSGITPGEIVKDQRGISYRVIIALSPGEDVFSRIIVQQLP